MFCVLTLLALQSNDAAERARSAEDWARSLVASPHYATADGDLRIAEWCELIGREPGHPLAELALAMIARTTTDRPRDAAAAIAALDARSIHPLAEEDLIALQRERALSMRPFAEFATSEIPELHPDMAGMALASGPLAGNPLDIPLGELCLDLERALALPRLFGSGPPRWIRVTRSGTADSLDVETACSADEGWAVVAMDFECDGRAGWFELDFSDATGPSWISLTAAEGTGLEGASGFEGLRVAFDDGSVREIDFLSAERSLAWREARVWRKGHNRVLLSLPLGVAYDFAARLRDLSGRALPWQASADPRSPLGEGRAAPASAQLLVGAIEHLEQVDPRGAHSEALLGLAKFRDGRMVEGLSHIDSALAMAPESVEIMALAADLYGARSPLPETWRRARARELVEAGLALAPGHVGLQVAMARILGPEDRQEEAVRALEGLDGERAGPAPWLALVDLYGELDLEVRAEAVLKGAVELRSESARVLSAAAEHWARRGFLARARDVRLAQLVGRLDLGALGELGELEMRLGQRNESIETQRSLARVTGDAGAAAGFARTLATIGMTGESDATWLRLAERFPQESHFPLRRADLAHQLGDRDGEVAQLRIALECSPSDREARARLAGLGEENQAAATFSRFAIDPAQELATFDPSRWSDHIVRALDIAVVHVFEDGAFEQWTLSHEVARDLEGCEALGKQRPSGDMLSIETLKRLDGKAYEPVLVDGEYVMPALEPGDAVRIVARGFASGGAGSRTRTTQWYFASTQAPYFLSRYVISIPKSLQLELVQRNFTGEHEVLDEGERVVHIFTLRDVDRVVTEPGAPPQSWFLPWVTFVGPQDMARIERELESELVVPTRLAPQLIEAASLACEGTETEEQRARALHRLVTESLDKREPLSRASALSALLTRSGNPMLLYATLLRAVGIEHELVWSRSVEPAADPAPERELADASRWTNQLLVLVKPHDAKQVWCDLSRKTLPYGCMIAASPRAEAFSATRGEWLAMPEAAWSERPGERTTLTVRVGLERSAEFDIALEFTGNMGFAVKEQLREVAKAQMKRTVTGIISRIVPGISLGDYSLEGLDDEATPVVFRAKGTHKTLFDARSGEFSCKLPFPALDLGRIAAGEGERKLPFLLQRASVGSVRARFELPEGRSLASEHPEVLLEFGGGRYRLAIEDASARGFTVVREFHLPAQVIAASDFAAFVEFAQRVDEADRVRVRLR
ncbi:MAG: hypothetical protein FJ294_00335 [Planctomycetes bacterium]|nr:hypothetical protein [Planctomycetota bacterium]